MNPLRWPFRAQFFLGFLICAGLLGYAIFLQLKMGLEPCPLCIFQRLAFAALGLLFLIGALHGPMLPPEMGATCGPPLSFLRETLGPLEVFRTVLTGTGNCGNIDWTFLGLTMPMWSGVWFVLLALWALVVSLRKVKR